MVVNQPEIHPVRFGKLYNVGNGLVPEDQW